MRRGCGVCHKVERDGALVSVTCSPQHELVAQGYCPECMSEAMAEMDGVAGALVAGGLTSPDWAVMRGQWHRCV